jgi:Double zinc ribbon
MTLAASDSFFDSSTWAVSRNLAIFFVVVLWLATAYWVLKDARRRIEDPWLVAMAALLGLVPPFLGPIVYLFFRPAEPLDERRERELEMRMIEERLEARDLRCPVCRGRVEETFLVCPVCTTRLKQACVECGAPLEAIWQACPFCAAAVPPASLRGDDVLEPLRPRRRRGAG